jgi:hypothetical protein
VKTAVSIPSVLFEQAEALAKQRGVSRSQLYAEALRQLVASQANAAVTASFDAAYAGGDDELDLWGDLSEFRRAARGAQRRPARARRPR